MNEPQKRSYRSTIRQQQAEETRRRVAAAGYELLLSEGYAGMTIDAVARRAEVSTQTVYAIFGSKRGILVEIIERATFGPRFEELVQQAFQATDPLDRLRYAAAIPRQIYDAEKDVLEVFRGASVVAPELSEMMKNRECKRYEAQGQLITFLHAAGRLKPGLDIETARDILWTLTGREIYRMLVQERGWSSDKYQEWLADTLVLSLTEAVGNRQ
jgi:AcrR family transcriptional regulator